MRLLALLLLLPTAATAQVTLKFELPWSSNLGTSATITLLRASSTGVISEITNQKQPLDLKGLTGERIVSFPGQASPMTVVGVRATMTFSNSWKGTLPATLLFAEQVPPQPNVVAAANQKVFCRLVWAFPNFQGDAKCGTDLAAVMPPAPTVGSEIPPPPPATQPAPPPADPCATKMPLNVPSITDGAGAVWKVDGQVSSQFGFTRDGEHVTDSADYVIVNSSGTACQKDGAAWECWSGQAKATGGKWVSQTAPLCP